MSIEKEVFLAKPFYLVGFNKKSLSNERLLVIPLGYYENL